MSKIYVVGIGPGDEEDMTIRAQKALKTCDVIVGYKTYTDLVRNNYPDKEIMESTMRSEVDRCKTCLELAKSGKTVALICSGDSGIYGMASPMLEIAAEDGFDDVEIVPGVTAALSGSAVLGAAVGHDLCTVSLSDLLTPWDRIEERLRCAARGDFCIAIYNPGSKKRAEHLNRACLVLLETIPADRPCGIVRNIGREDTEVRLCTLGELADETVDMFTTVFIGNSTTYVNKNRLITPRGYKLQ
ncbi:MAG: precorrin-3B C(17)-methyltransferase [Lachnospiraceae bacterium]|nr:precorrin-3B C(17)-methyltransferase [Lachnospiraceae bacterium]